MATEEPLYKASFVVGEAVKITDGPFTDFLGTIDNIDEAKANLSFGFHFRTRNTGRTGLFTSQ